MPRLIAILLWAPVAVLALSACTVSIGEEDAYEDSQITPTLEMPPNIIRKESRRNLMLPGSKVGTDENIGRYVDTGDLNVAARSLPSVEGVHIAGSADLYWLHVPQSPRDVYALVREFWLSEGFEFALDEPLMGILKTEWASVTAGEAEGFFGQLLAGMRAADFKYQYTTRIESSADNTASNVFIAHREQERHLLENPASITDAEKQIWLFRQPDPAREFEILSRLMLFMGMQDDQVKAQLAQIPALPNRVQLVRGDEDSPSNLSVAQDFVQVWNRLRHQFSRNDIKLLESSRDGLEGMLIVDAASFYSRLEGPQGPARATLQFELKGHDNAELTLVGVIDDSGSRDKSADAVAILQRLSPLLR